MFSIADADCILALQTRLPHGDTWKRESGLKNEHRKSSGFAKQSMAGGCALQG